MPTTKKNTVHKGIKKKRGSASAFKKAANAEDTLFPEKLARVKAILKKAILLPD